MAKYKEFKITWGSEQFIFVTRGRSKQFEAEEAITYLKERNYQTENELCFPDKPVEPVKDVKFEEAVEAVLSTWRIPNDKSRKHMFRKDLQAGMPFCIKKYGQTRETIELEAKRLSLGGF